MTTALECGVARSALLHAKTIHRNAVHAGKYEWACTVCTMLANAVILVDALCNHPDVQENKA